MADSQSGYTVISGKALAGLPLEKLYTGYGFPNHFLVLLNIYSRRVTDVAVRPVYGIGEQSGMHIPQVIPKISWLLIKSFGWRLKEKYIIRDFHPLIFFFSFGVFLMASGVALGLYCFYLRFMVGPIAAPAVVFSGFLIVTAMQALLFAMWMDMEYNKNLR